MNRKAWISAVLLAIAVLAISGGCASPVPGSAGQGALSGRRLKVKLVFDGQVNPGYFYYFLINNTNSQSAPGPIPVGPPTGLTYGNGFATGSDSKSGGFTDFVMFSANQYATGTPAANFALYHVQDGGDANNRALFQGNGVPVAYSAPVQTDGHTIYFELDLAQLFPSSSQVDARTKGQALRFIQVNVVATNNTPQVGATGITKAFDSLGDDSDGHGNYLQMDLNQSAYVNGDTVLAATTTEPTFNDVFVVPAGGYQDPSLNLRDWSIQIATTN